MLDPVADPAGADVDAVPAEGARLGQTALFYAVRYNQGRALSRVAALLEARVNPAHEDRHGQTALYYAARYSSAAVVALLCARTVGAARQRDCNRQTPVFYAAAGGRAAVLRTLAASGFTMDAADAVGDTPFDYAARHGHVACYAWLQGLRDGAGRGGGLLELPTMKVSRAMPISPRVCFAAWRPNAAVARVRGKAGQHTPRLCEVALWAWKYSLNV